MLYYTTPLCNLSAFTCAFVAAQKIDNASTPFRSFVSRLYLPSELEPASAFVTA